MSDTARNAHTLVIVNHIAARARRAWPRIRATLAEHNVSFDAHETTHAGDATAATRAALLAGYKTVAVVGGDGTLSEAAAGFFQLDDDENQAINNPPKPINTDAALAILPAGTGDDFARGLTNGQRQPLASWLSRLINHTRYATQDNGQLTTDNGQTTHQIDLIHATAIQTNNGTERPHSFLFINMATIGLGAEVARRVGEQRGLVRRLSGEARFVAAACGALAAWRERSVRVVVDEEEAIECRSNLLAVANGVYAGGGMMFAPHARLDDGKLDALVSCGITRAIILRELPRIRRGTHLSNPRVHSAQATRVRIETDSPEDALHIEADGNLRGHTPAEFRLIPNAIRIVTP